jgi:mannose-1-phosphate guanylyltransferase
LKVIILAGGVGTRLRPLSCTRPKLLFPVLNKPLLDGTLEQLAKIGVNEVILATKYMAEVFMQRYGKSKHGIKLSYSIENKPMGTGGAIKYAEELIGQDEPFLVLNGDIITTINYASFIKKHNKKNAVATIALHRVEDPRRYGTVKINEKNKITQFIEKAPKKMAPSNLINAGVYILEPEIFKYIPSGHSVSIEREVFPELAKENRLFGYEFKDFWIDIGKPADYLKANRVLLEAKKENRPKTNLKMEQNIAIIDPVLISTKVRLGINSKIGPYTTIGKGTVVGRNVTIRNSVIFPNVTIEDEASIEGAIVGEGVNIGENTKISEGCIIGDNAIIHENITISRDVTVCHSKEVKENVQESKRII